MWRLARSLVVAVIAVVVVTVLAAAAAWGASAHGYDDSAYTYDILTNSQLVDSNASVASTACEVVVEGPVCPAAQSSGHVYDSARSLVAPSGLVNETAGGLTNLGRGSARGPAFFDDFSAGQGFSGVCDEATGSILAFPSGPGGVVPRRGGHAVVNQRLTEAVGVPGGQRAGFTAILQTDGSLQVQWLSRSVNPSGYVPNSLRPAITDALSQTSGRSVVG